jgi:hypothetical protein
MKDQIINKIIRQKKLKITQGWCGPGTWGSLREGTKFPGACLQLFGSLGYSR